MNNPENERKTLIETDFLAERLYITASLAELSRLVRILEEKGFEPRAANEVVVFAAAMSKKEHPPTNNKLPVNEAKPSQQAIEQTAAIVANYRERIFSFFVRRTRDPNVAADLTQDTLQRILLNIDEFTPKRTATAELWLQGWIFAIARNILKNYYRDKKRALNRIPRNLIAEDESYSLLDVFSSNVDDPEKIVSNQEFKDLLYSVIAKMNRERQLLLYLKLYFDLTNLEIGAVLGKSEGSIKSLYWRTLRKLEDYIQLFKNQEMDMEQITKDTV